jgi:hypothetical protein
VDFKEHIKEMVLQPMSSTSSYANCFVHPKVVASFLLIPLPSSSNLLVNVELSNAKWKLEFGGQKPNPKITKF